MSGIPHSTNPIAIAKETVAISKQLDSPAFQKAASWMLVASAAVTAALGLVHAIKSIARDLTGKPDSRSHGDTHARQEPKTAATDIEEKTPLAKASGHERSWVILL